MKKLEKDLYIKHAKRLQAIIDEQSTFSRFITRKDFIAVLKNELNVLFACERLFPKVDLDAKYTAKHLTKEFNKLTKADFSLDEKYKYEDEMDLIDSINYLVTFCNNMFRVNIDDILSGKNVTATDPHIDLKAKPEFSDSAPRMNANLSFAAGVPLAATPYENPYLIGKAYAKMNDDMKQGKFYRYKTKPRIIPIVKWIASILTILLSLTLIATSVFWFMVQNISDGIFFIIGAGFGAYPTFLTLKSLVGKGGKNPNLKYYFSWTFFAMFLIFAVILPAFNITLLIWADPEQDLLIFNILKILEFICFGLIGAIIIPIVIGAISNPKLDSEIIEKKLKEYIDLFSSESGQVSVPPRTETQTPTDVKESKNDSSDKKSTKK